MYAPHSYQQPCNESSNINCHIGDLIGKEGYFDGGSPRVLYVDDDIPLSGTYSVVNRSLVLSNSEGEILACSTLQALSLPDQKKKAPVYWGPALAVASPAVNELITDILTAALPASVSPENYTFAVTLSDNVALRSSRYVVVRQASFVEGLAAPYLSGCTVYS
jgi:hypothetical protein